MNFDPVAFAMGKAGVSRNVLSALMGGNGGGVTLETSGWVYSAGAKTTVEGNAVTMASGSTSHDLILRVPAALRESQKFESGDVFVLALTVTSISHRLYASPQNTTGGTVTIKNGIFKKIYNHMIPVYDEQQIGDDVLTWSFNADCENVRILPAAGTGSESSTVSAAIEVTGIAFNGTVIYGKV